MSKLYRIYQSENNGYDTYDSAVVVANSEDEARKIHPGGGGYRSDTDSGTWVQPQFVEVEYLGEAREGLDVGIEIVASFNAG